MSLPDNTTTTDSVELTYEVVTGEASKEAGMLWARLLQRGRGGYHVRIDGKRVVIEEYESLTRKVIKIT